MNIFSIIAIIGSAGCLFLGIYILSIDRKNKLNRLYFYICMNLFFWLLCVSISISAHTKEGIILSYKIASFFFMSFSAFNLYFYLVLTGKKLKPFIILTIFIPSFLLIYATWFNLTLFSDFIFIDGQWKFIPATQSFWFYLYNLYITGYTAVTMYIIISYGRRSRRNKDKNMTKILASLFAMMLTLGVLFDIILPGFDFYKLPALGTLFFIIYAGGIYYAVFRYKFLTIKPSIVADELISNIDEIVFILDDKLNVTTANKQYLIHSPNDADMIKGKNFCDLTENSKDVKLLLDRILSGVEKKIPGRIIYRGRIEPVVTDSYISSITDNFSDLVGILIISNENKGSTRMRTMYKLTDREFEIIELSIAGLSYREISEKLGIVERTVETHLNNIYGKLRISNKIELLHLAYEFNLLPVKPV